jgi:hypothetical protein
VLLIIYHADFKELPHARFEVFAPGKMVENGKGRFSRISAEKKYPQISIPSARATARALPSLPHIKFLLSLAKDEAVF